MSWLKKITNRFFGEEKEDSDSVYDFEEVEYGEEPSHKKTAFRFPIITDAEIYGWDENEYEKNDINKSQSEEVLQQDLAEDEFEPIPFFENERWPGKEQQPKVHLSSAHYERKQVPDVKINYNEINSEQIKEAKNDKNFKSRFSPTTVPSPIYGFSNPDRTKTLTKNKTQESNNEESELQSALVLDQEVLETHSELTKHNQSLLKDSILEKETIATDFVQAKDSSQDTKEPPTEELEEKIETYTEVIGSEAIENKSVELPNERTEEIEEDKILNNTNVERITEATKLEENIKEVKEVKEDNEREQKEKTIPFNVMMLKSDKEKLSKLQQKPVYKENKVLEVEKQSVESIIQEKEAVELSQKEIETQNYRFPPMDYLLDPESHIEDTEWLTSQSEKLEESLSHFGVQATVIESVQGPTVTRFELTVGQGTKVSRVRNLTDDLKLALAAKEIRIQAPIPGKSSIGIEIPNRQTRPVRISEVIETEDFRESDSPLEAVLGLGLTGKPVTLDLRKMPHGLIAGATGSGKSVCINSILVSLLYKAHPADLKMMLIDPKMVELAPFNGVPHLISPVITDVKAATAALKWAVGEMDRRYELLAHAGVRDIERYNKVAIEKEQYSLKMPYLLIVIDELADLMMMAPADVEISISRIAQKARACGIHLIIATQRPSVDVITGTIKANIPTRIAFSVSSQIDSRTIIDTTGAERLLGRGDMLYIGNGQSAPIRLQGTFVTDDEIERIIEHVQEEASPHYLFGQDELLKSASEEEADPLFEEVCLFLYEQGSASTSLLQRNFSIGYNRAAKLMDRLESIGYISEQRGSKARDVFITESDLSQFSAEKI